jgi:SAM-dependent methyltransferase
MTPIAGEASFIVILAPKTTNPTPFTQTSSIINLSRRMVLILYTTQYKTGGPEMARAAETMARQKPHAKAIKIESKAELIAAVNQHGALDELHLIGHSGLYGPMFGTTKFPEQFSRAEWRALEIPFTPNARAFFHCCRGGRWFAPYFARRYQIPASGHLSYTTFSADPVRYAPVLPEPTDVYVVSVPGRKASGIFAAAKKRLGIAKCIPLTEFSPSSEVDESYDHVSDLYDDVFRDFRVREDEWRFITHHLPAETDVLDIGCGNGALLCALSGTVKSAVGVDASPAMIAKAQHNGRFEHHLSFRVINGPILPFPDQSFDVVISVLAWRYLDWDPMVAEIHRVLRPGGRVILIDMAVSPLDLTQLPTIIKDRARHVSQSLRNPNFKASLKRMVEDQNWREMVRQNPMRAEHEYRNYLPSRFEGIQIKVLNRSLRSEMLGAIYCPKNLPEKERQR